MDDIARYAEGLMEASELQDFEAALAADADLQEQYNLYTEAEGKLKRHIAAEQGEEELRATLQGMRKEFFSAPVIGNTSPVRAKVVKLMWRKVAITAAAAILIGLFLWQPWQGEDLYTKYAATEMVSSVERGTHTDSLLANATKAFNAKEFTSAATYLYEVVEAQPENSFARFYYGVSLMQTGKTELARGAFTALSKGSSAFKDEALFYMGLSYLKDNDKENCKKWLQQVPAGSGAYEKAQKLLQDL